MPFAQPSFLQGANIGGLQRLQGQLPGLFNTKPLEQSYQNLASSNLDTGRALAAAAGASYSNRAAQSGASRQGAGFAAAQAMLPIYGQNNALMADLATKKLQAQTGQAGAGIDISSTIAKLLSARQGMLADYSLGSQRLQQQGQQFNTDLGFRREQLAQQDSQFQQSQGSDTRLKALQLAMQMPRQHYSWNTNRGGLPETATDAANMTGFDQQQNFFGSLRGQLANLI